MNVDFADSQLTQRVSKLFSIPIKKESNGKIAKKQQTTDTDLHYDQVEGRPCFMEAVNLFASMFIYLFNSFFVVFFCTWMQHPLFMGQFYVLAETNFK